MNIIDPLDRVFYSCLKEIELSYSSFSKSLRIRIERWIEKLSMSGISPDLVPRIYIKLYIMVALCIQNKISLVAFFLFLCVTYVCI